MIFKVLQRRQAGNQSNPADAGTAAFQRLATLESEPAPPLVRGAGEPPPLPARAKPLKSCSFGASGAELMGPDPKGSPVLRGF